MYRRLRFANYSLLRIRDLSGPYRHRCTPQKKSCWHEEGENTCLSQTELSTSQVFSVYIFQVAKLIPFLLLPVEFTVLWSVLCEVWTERDVDGGLSAICGISLWFVPYSILVPDNSCFLFFPFFSFFWLRKVCWICSLGVFLVIILLLPFRFYKSFQYVNHHLWLASTEQRNTPAEVALTGLVREKVTFQMRMEGTTCWGK